MSGRSHGLHLPHLPAVLLLTTALVLSSLVTLPQRAAAVTLSSKVMLGRLTTAAEHARGFAQQPRPRWTDLDGDGCSTGLEVLLRDARTAPRVGPECTLSGGTWISRYDGVQGSGLAGLAVDRLIPLAEAWRSGARRWSAGERRVFANDLGYRASLLVLSKDMRLARDDQEPQDWLPDGKRRSCRYMAQWVAVKYRWGLTVDDEERDFLTDALSACDWPQAPLPGRPPVPEVRGLGAASIAASSMLARCTIRTSEPAHVVVRFGPVGRKLWRRSSGIDVAPGNSVARLNLHGLLPSTAYAFRCTATTPNTGVVRAPGILQATTLARVTPTTSPTPALTSSPAPTAASAPSPTMPSPTMPPPTTPPPATTLPPTTPPPTTPPPTTPPPPPAGGGTKVVAVGDMCEPNPVTSCNATGNIAASLHPTLYALLGDTQYEKGTPTEYANGYAKSSWNALKGSSLPTIGNHEILTANAAGYCGYFFTVSSCPRWYAYDIDANWRAVVLDSNQPANSTQLHWLDAELATDTNRNLLVYWHHARWRNSGHVDAGVDVLMRKVYAAHADIVLWGHDHMYTQWKKMGPNGPAADGFKAFTVGTGGADEVKPANTSYPGTVKNLVEFGVLELTLRAGDYSWRFVNTSGVVRDSGSDIVTP